MSQIFNKKKEDLEPEEYIVRYCLIYLGMRKIKDESIQKILNDDNNR